MTRQNYGVTNFPFVSVAEFTKGGPQNSHILGWFYHIPYFVIQTFSDEDDETMVRELVHSVRPQAVVTRIHTDWEEDATRRYLYATC